MMLFILFLFFQQSRVEVIEILPHNSKSFTQGLAVYQGKLYESTGLNGESYVYIHSLDMKKTLAKTKLDNRYFGEGLTVFNNQIYQITWKSSTAFVYDSQNLKRIKEMSYALEGWGLASDGNQFYMSDGSSRIYLLKPDNFQEQNRLTVRYNGKELDGLNELEYVNGYLWANVLFDNHLYKIDLESGDVIDLIDLSFIVKAHRKQNDHVLNGIAYDHDRKLFYIGGKKWDTFYLIRIKE